MVWIYHQTLLVVSQGLVLIDPSTVPPTHSCDSFECCSNPPTHNMHSHSVSVLSLVSLITGILSAWDCTAAVLLIRHLSHAFMRFVQCSVSVFLLDQIHLKVAKSSLCRPTANFSFCFYFYSQLFIVISDILHYLPCRKMAKISGQWRHITSLNVLAELTLNTPIQSLGVGCRPAVKV